MFVEAFDQPDPKSDSNLIISIESLSELTGFPVELIKEELLVGDKVDPNGSLTMGDLRHAMRQYLTKTLG